MNFQDDDIDYKKLHWKRFEELCFDMLLKYQYHSLNWHQGGSDGGRDIEAKYNTMHPVTGPYEEKWFIECKHHTKGLGVAVISDKLELARVKQIDHFFLITTTYLTKDTKDWLEDRRAGLNFKVHILEGKNLKKKLLLFPELVSQYFADDTTKLVRELLKHWLMHDILPTIETLEKLWNEVQPEKLSAEELVFLLFAFSSIDSDLVDDEMYDEFSFDYLFPFIAKFENRTFPVLEPHEYSGGGVYNQDPGWSSKSYTALTDRMSYHTIEELDEKRKIEIYFCRDSGRISDFRIGVGIINQKN